MILCSKLCTVEGHPCCTQCSEEVAYVYDLIIHKCLYTDEAYPGERVNKKVI